MSRIYLALETMGLIVVLILLYANYFEIKQRTKKRRLFSYILILNGLIILSDAISWLHFDWNKMPELLWCLVVASYILPFFAQAVFSNYLYEHISETVKVSRIPFRFVIGYSVLLGVFFFVFCFTGKLFTIENGKYYSGQYEFSYYLLYIVALIIFMITILAYSKKMGAHDVIAALSYCIIPGIAIAISLSDLGINLSIAFLAIEVLVIYIMLQSERESNLIYQSNNDELTGLYNRRAYEDDLLKYPDFPVEEDFVYASIDVNGLKQVNDNLGHAAGDEIICGAADCLKRTFGNYGKVYRTGGDEFVAMFFADEDRLRFLINDLEQVTSQWAGNYVDSLSLSVGYVSKREFSNESVNEISKIADKRMYKAKSEYYSKKGIDRRGQAAAYSALCAIYTKILKINLTEDTYSIVNMDLSEQTTEKGFADTISGWLTGFGESGQVFRDDLDEYRKKTDINYLRDYFSRGKTSISIQYRRKYEDEYKLVAMEMIPAKDYTDDNQTLFLYVKNIDAL